MVGQDIAALTLALQDTTNQVVGGLLEGGSLPVGQAVSCSRTRPATWRTSGVGRNAMSVGNRAKT